MRYRDLIRKLRKLGCEFERQGRRSHEIWVKLGTELEGTVPDWGSKDLKLGTVRKILRDLQIDRRDVDQA